MPEISQEKAVYTAIEKLWFEINDRVIDLKKKGVMIPQQAFTSLRGAKVLINLCRHHPKLAHDIGPSEIDTVQGICVTCCGAGIVARIECELRKIEELMIPKSINAGLGDEYVIQWQNKIRAY